MSILAKDTAGVARPLNKAFTPCLQFQYAYGKNTSDIALALDALEALFDGRAEKFCIVTSDSDFAYLCRKLRERGATYDLPVLTKAEKGHYTVELAPVNR